MRGYGSLGDAYCCHGRGAAELGFKLPAPLPEYLARMKHARRCAKHCAGGRTAEVLNSRAVIRRGAFQGRRPGRPYCSNRLLS